MPGRLRYRATNYDSAGLVLGWVVGPDGNKPLGPQCVLEFNKRVSVTQELLDDPDKFLWEFQMRQMS